MVDFIKNGDQGVFSKNVFKPKRFGELTKDITGQFKNVTEFDVAPNFKHNNSAPILKMIRMAHACNDSVYDISAKYSRKSNVNEVNSEFMDSFVAASNVDETNMEGGSLYYKVTSQFESY